MVIRGQSAAPVSIINYAMPNMQQINLAINTSKLEKLLYDDSGLSHETIQQAQQIARKKHTTLLRQLINSRALSSKKILYYCKKIYDLPIFKITKEEKFLPYLESLSLHFICHYQIIPIQKENDYLHVLLADPTDQTAINAILFQTGLKVKIYLTDYETFEALIETIHSSRETNQTKRAELIKRITAEKKALHESVQLADQHILDEAPLIQLVDNLISQAQKQHASDIHIEPSEKYCRIRFRQHGVLQTVSEIPQPLTPQLITRLKVMARLDIAERRLPQDGRFHFNKMDIRISTCPTIDGEKIVLRLLNTNQTLPSIQQIGMSDAQQVLFQKMLSEPQGMILVTGPTGSGKTVSLYSALHYLNQPEKNISTVEDPVEIRLNGINQMTINHKTGFTFAAALRALLRQDPDILMVGEIRDQETAHIAIQAAQTGHLVLSTLHTTGTIETIARLQAMQIPTGYLANALKLIVAQRLIRTLCQTCCIPEQIEQNTQTIQSWRAVGCSLCSQGYTGRTAIHEFLPINESIANELSKGSTNTALLRKIVIENGFLSLREHGLQKVATGMTTHAELTRVLGQ